MAFGSEIKRLRENAGVTANAMVQLIGIDSLVRYKAWEQRDAYPKYEDRRKIEKFFGMELEEIMKLKKIPPELLEKSNEKKEDSEKSYPLNQGENEEVKESNTSYVATRFKKKLQDKEIPVVGGFTNLGNIEVYNDEKREIVGSLPQNVFPGCDYAERAKGDSMYPIIMNQALLVGKTCNKDGIVWGEKYIIKTKTGLDTTKFVHPVEADETKLELKAHNKSIPPQKINIDDIVFCCRVHWIINPT